MYKCFSFLDFVCDGENYPSPEGSLINSLKHAHKKYLAQQLDMNPLLLLLSFSSKIVS